MRDDIPSNNQNGGWDSYDPDRRNYAAWLDAYSRHAQDENAETGGRTADSYESPEYIQNHDDGNEISSYGGYSERDTSFHTGGYSYVRKGERIAPTEEYYSHSEQAGNFFPNEEAESGNTRPLSDLSEYPGYVQRSIENTGYVIFGQDPEENASPTAEREMRSHSAADRYSSAEAERNKKKSAKLEKREYKRRNRIKAKRNRRVFFSVWLVMVILVAVTLGEYLAAGAGDVFAMSRTKELTADITIPEDASLEDVTNILYDGKVIGDKKFFKLYCTLTNADQFGRGEFEIPTNMDYEGIINYLLSNSNRVDTVEIMFPEGGNILEVAQKLEENEVCTVEEVLAVANTADFNDYDLIAAAPSSGRYYKIEGYLFPDTYEFYKGEDPVDALSKMIYTCDTRFSKKLRKAAEEKEMTIDEVLVMASLVQAEASNTEDMKYIASIIQNRLLDGAEYDIYTLDLDSTMYYPYRTKDTLPADKAGYISDYNTYTVQGLPGGPICNPGLDAIEAVLYPEETSYYYFCHDAEGTPYYASSFYEHQENLVEAGLMDAEDLYG